MGADARLLEVEGLVTRYPIPRGVLGTIARRPALTVQAVDGVSFSVGAGEMVALVGESGCGKTSTAQTVIRMVDESGGLDPLSRDRDRHPRGARVEAVSARDPDHLPGSVRVPRSTIHGPRHDRGADSRARARRLEGGPRGEGPRGDGAGRADARGPLHRPLSRTSSPEASGSASPSRRRSCSSRSC